MRPRRGSLSAPPRSSDLDSARARALATLALAGLVLGLLGASVVASSDHVDHWGLTVTILLSIGAAWIGTGLFA